MRIYINGTLSKEQNTFLPEDLWFATSNCEDDTIVSSDCLCLEGELCESQVEGKTFSCRWKGVSLLHVENGEEIETSDFSVKEFMKLTQKMRLKNMSAYFDSDTDVHLTEVKLVDAYDEVCFPVERIDDIEFID